MKDWFKNSVEFSMTPGALQAMVAIATEDPVETINKYKVFKKFDRLFSKLEPAEQIRVAKSAWKVRPQYKLIDKIYERPSHVGVNMNKTYQTGIVDLLAKNPMMVLEIKQGKNLEEDILSLNKHIKTNLKLSDNEIIKTWKWVAFNRF